MPYASNIVRNMSLEHKDEISKRPGSNRSFSRKLWDVSETDEQIEPNNFCRKLKTHSMIYNKFNKRGYDNKTPLFFDYSAEMEFNEK